MVFRLRRSIFLMIYTKVMRMMSSKMLPITMTMISTTFSSSMVSKKMERLTFPPELLMTPIRILLPSSEYSKVSSPDPVKTCLPCTERSRQLTIPAISLEELCVCRKREIAPLKVKVILIFFWDSSVKEVQVEAASVQEAVVDSSTECRRCQHMVPMWKESQEEQQQFEARMLAGTGQLLRKVVPSVTVAVKLKDREGQKFMIEKQIVCVLPGFAIQAY